MAKITYDVSDVPSRPPQTRYKVKGKPPKGWPKPMTQAAYHGPLGRIAQIAAPETEAAPDLILGGNLVMFGNGLGRTQWFRINETNHYTNLFALFVGISALGRKGTALDINSRAMSLADPTWAHRQRGFDAGIASGEALIMEVRDPAGDDPGEEDKRFCAVFSEFAEMLGKMAIENSSLGQTVRKLWDGKPVRNKTKGKLVSCNEPHVSLVGNITEDELKRRLDQTDLVNGFLNRFLLFGAYQTQLLPRGGDLMIESDCADEIEELSRAFRWATDHPGEMGMTREAWDLWDDFYIATMPSRKMDKSLAKIIGRGQPTVRRLSMIYAVADRKKMVEPVHLLAAMEVWRYSEEMTKYTFTDAPKSKASSSLLDYLKESRPHDPSANGTGGWIAQAAITTRFKNRTGMEAFRLEGELADLVRRGRLDVRIVPTPGRPRTEYRFVK